MTVAFWAHLIWCALRQSLSFPAVARRAQQLVPNPRPRQATTGYTLAGCTVGGWTCTASLVPWYSVHEPSLVLHDLVQSPGMILCRMVVVVDHHVLMRKGTVLANALEPC